MDGNWEYGSEGLLDNLEQDHVLWCKLYNTTIAKIESMIEMNQTLLK
jgi:hypothetical protein